MPTRTWDPSTNGGGRAVPCEDAECSQTVGGDDEDRILREYEEFFAKQEHREQRKARAAAQATAEPTFTGWDDPDEPAATPKDADAWRKARADAKARRQAKTLRNFRARYDEHWKDPANRWVRPFWIFRSGVYALLGEAARELLTALEDHANAKGVTKPGLPRCAAGVGRDLKTMKAGKNELLQWGIIKPLPVTEQYQVGTFELQRNPPAGLAKRLEAMLNRGPR